MMKCPGPDDVSHEELLARRDGRAGRPSVQALRHRLSGRHNHRSDDAAPLGYLRQPDALDDWRSTSSAMDNQNAADRGLRVRRQPPEAGGAPRAGGYLEWLRQRVLGWTGRPFRRGEARHRQYPWAARRIKGGDPRFWALVTALADAVQEAGTLTWRKARDILRGVDQRWLPGEHPRLSVLSGIGAQRPQNN